MDAGTVRIVEGWYFQLPHTVQQSMASEMQSIYDNGTIQTYLDAVQRHVPQTPGRIELCVMHCPYCPGKVDFTCSCETMRKLQHFSKNKKRDSRQTQAEPRC
jgi:hypothetical protein